MGKAAGRQAVNPGGTQNLTAAAKKPTQSPANRRRTFQETGMKFRYALGLALALATAALAPPSPRARTR